MGVPDEAVLLSDGFAATHCFRSVRHRNRPGQIGVAFEPAPKRKRSDIQGVLWLDEASSELREIRFQFVNAGILSRFEPGGFTRFHRMPSGAWIVSEWQLRMPQLEYRLGPVPTTAVTGYIVNGGEVVLSGR